MKSIKIGYWCDINLETPLEVIAREFSATSLLIDLEYEARWFNKCELLLYRCVPGKLNNQ